MRFPWCRILLAIYYLQKTLPQPNSLPRFYQGKIIISTDLFVIFLTQNTFCHLYHYPFIIHEKRLPNQIGFHGSTKGRSPTLLTLRRTSSNQQSQCTNVQTHCACSRLPNVIGGKKMLLTSTSTRARVCVCTSCRDTRITWRFRGWRSARAETAIAAKLRSAGSDAWNAFSISRKRARSITRTGR